MTGNLVGADTNPPTARIAMSDLPAATAPTRVFLVDDHEVVRRGLRDLIDDEPDMEAVGEAATAEQALCSASSA